MPPVVRPYRGVSAETRRAERRERLLDAALDEIVAAGVSGLKVKSVCVRAGLTERYFYESFSDRDALFGALHDRVHAQLDETLGTALAAAPAQLEPQARAAMQAVITVLTDDPRIARGYTQMAATESLRLRLQLATEQYAGLVAALLREFADLRAPRHQPRIELVAHILVSGLIQTIGSWLDGTIALSRDELIDELALLAVAAAGAVRDSA